MAKVRWETGGISQNEMNEDDLPWSKPMFPVTNPSLKRTGGFHTGLREGTKVYGFSPSGDGQDMIIIGTVVAAGNGEIDQQANYDSDIPTAAKNDKSHGPEAQAQPQHGDKNSVVTEESIIKYAQDEGGPEKKPAEYAEIPEPIGTLSYKIGGD